MVKVMVSKGRRLWDTQNRREATAGDIVEVRDIDARILKFRGLAEDVPVAPVAAPARRSTARAAPVPLAAAAAPEQPPAAPPVPEPAPAAPEPDTPEDEATTVVDPGDEQQIRRRGLYRRRDMQPEGR